MNSPTPQREFNGIAPLTAPGSHTSRLRGARRRPPGRFTRAVLLAFWASLLFVAPAARADRSPPGCAGSGLGISLFTSVRDVHIGDTIYYSVNVFNAALPACDAGATNPAMAGAIRAFVVTPDGVTNPVVLRRTYLLPGQSDFYTNVVSYVVRAQDLRPDGTVRATASDEGDIHQNDTNSRGGGDQGVNTEVNLPCVHLTAKCVGTVGELGAITYTGTVSNCGNSTLVGVTVTNFYETGFHTVLFPTNLAVGQAAAFAGSWVPASPCQQATATLTVQATDEFTSTPRAVTSFVTMTCQNTLTPRIKVVKLCPEQRVSAGQLLTFSGSVSNSGDATLTDIVVVNDQPVPNTVVFTRGSLAPGASAAFTGSYRTPLDCFVTDTLTARASSTCGLSVTNSASATCPLATAPQIQVTAVCPPVAPPPGSSLAYSGTVWNTGNIPLTNVVVVSDRPAPGTVVYTAPSLAVGASAGFTAVVAVPAGVCSVATSFRATGNDLCAPVAVTNTHSTVCAIGTAPALAVALACPAAPVAPGAPATYTGTVRNSGNILLKNVVVNRLGASGTVLAVPSLAPGATALFSATFNAPADACSTATTVTAAGSDDCAGMLVSNTASATCALVTTARLVVTQNCPAAPARLGGVLIYSGSVSNAGDITLTNVVVLNSRSGAVPVFATAALAPGATARFTGDYTVPASSGCSITSALTASGYDKCTGSRVAATDSSTCPVLTAPAIVVTQSCPATPIVQGGLLTYTGTVSNSGNITLSNIVVVNNWPAPNTVVFTTPFLAPGARTNFTGSYVVPPNCCVAWSTVQARGQDCSGVVVTDTDSGTCAVLTSPRIVLTKVCGPGGLRPGDLLTYSGVVSNAGDIALINFTLVNEQAGPGSLLLGPISLAPGESIPYDAAYIVPGDFCGADTVTARGLDACFFSPVVQSVTTTCAMAPYHPAISVTKHCPALPTPHGGQLVFSGTVRNLGDVTLVNVYVVNNQPSNNAPVLGPVTLAPGEFLDFTGSYQAPAVCCEMTDTLTARGQDRCGQSSVAATATAVCPLLYTPGIVLVQECPPAPLPMGSLYAFSGYVTNTGDTILTNVTVFTTQAGQRLTWLGPLDLAPGQAELYAGSVIVPSNTCTVPVSASSQETCSGSWVTNITGCPVLTIPSIAITQKCPPNPVSPAGLVAFSGSIRNAGNITLLNVVVMNDHTGAVPLLTLDSLAPGVSASFSGSYTAPAIGNATSTASVGATSLCGAPVTNSASSTCPVLTSPGLAITKACPPAPVAAGGILTFTGTVTNTGNITLTNVFVINDQPVANTRVLGPITLAPREGTNFAGSYTVALETCAATDTLTATGNDANTGITITTRVSATCPILTVPSIAITLNCPTNPVTPGGLLVYSGTVRNAGNVTLSNIVVLNDHTGATPVLSLVSLAPGVTAPFSGSFLAPLTGDATSTASVRATSLCGVSVTNSASSTCPILTSPGLAITKACPPAPVAAGGILTFTGTVTNTGNITLTNVFVMNDQPVANTRVLGPITLAPREGTNFAGSYTVALETCAATDTLTATGNDANTGITITTRVSATCPILTVPSIAITLNCPTNPVSPGGLLFFSGTVRNAGNVTLSNIVVLNDHTGATPVLSLVSLAPGVTAPFSGSFLAPLTGDATSTASVRATSLCGVSLTNSASSTCPVLTSPGLAITKACPPAPVAAGGILTFTGTVTNTGNITLTNVFVMNDRPVANTRVLGPITLAPREGTNFAGSYTVALETCAATDTLTATGNDANTGILLTTTVSATCPILTVPSIAITLNCPTNPVTPGGLLAFSGTVRNAGNVTLSNIVVLNDHTGVVPVLSLASLAPGVSAPFVGSFLAPLTGDATSTASVRATSLCGVSLTNSASSTCPILTSPGLALTKACPPAPVAAGGILTFTGTVTNTGNITLTNVFVMNDRPVANTRVLGPITLAPREGTNFAGSYTVALETCAATDTLTATGNDANTGILLSTTVSATCPILTVPSIAITLNCPTNPVTPGGLLAFSGTIRNAGNVTLNNIVVLNDHTGATPVLSLASLAPGVSAPFSGSFLAPLTGDATSTASVRATSLCGVSVTNSASSTCPILTTPGLALTKACPPAPVVAGGILTFTGTVTNTGNITLTNVFVMNDRPVANTRVLGPITLAPREGTNFAGSYTVALDACAATDTLTASGNDANTGILLTTTVSATCPILTVPSIAITLNCPTNPVTPGGLLAFSGTIRNAGNVTLNNIVVLNDHTGATPALTLASLAPGVTAPFSGSFLAPLTGDATSTASVRATSLCGVSLTNSASSTCPILTTPGLALTKACPPAPVAAGGILTFTGTVTNTGNITLTNVFVMNDRPVASTRVLGPITLAPREGTNFAGSYTVGLDTCAATDTLTATGNDANTGILLTTTVSATCAVVSTPGISITETCPPGPVSAGSSVVFGGVVSNTGNITLTNVLVVSSQPAAGTPVLGPIILVPGAFAPFTGSYIATGGANPATNVTILTNSAGVIITNVASVITTNTATTVITNAAGPASFATINSVAQTVVDRFPIGDTFMGLTYAGEDHGYGATELYSMRKDTSGTSFFDTIIPSTATTTDRFNASGRSFDALAYASPDLGYGPLLFYYLSHDNAGVSTFGSITPGGVVGVVADHFVAGYNFDALTFTATDVGYGANLFYYIRHDASGLSTFGTINPALPGTITDRFAVGNNVDALVFTDLGAPGFGPNNFYYLRHDASGTTVFGTIFVTGLTSATVTDRFAAGANGAELTFTATDVGFGANLFYMIRRSVSSLSTNVVTTFLTNTVITLTTNTVQTFTTNSVVTFTPTNTVSASGLDVCQARRVSAAADCLGPVAPALGAARMEMPSMPVIGAPRMVNGLFTLSFPTESGKSYTVQYKNTLNDPAWIDTDAFLGTGEPITVTDLVIPGQPSRFYRILLTQ